jgi:PAS domain S-box-containing protein
MMAWQLNPYSFVLGFVALVAAAIAWAAWRRRPKPGAVPLAVLMLALTHWSFFYALEMLAASVENKMLWIKIEYIGIVLVPASWLALMLQYTGLDARWLSRRNLWLLTIEPIGLLLLAWTNELHGLVWAETGTELLGNLQMFRSVYGPAFWVHTAYSYLLLVTGVLLLIWAAVRGAGPYRAQALLLLVGAMVPWVSNGISIFGLVDVPFDLTAFAFTVTGATSFWALFRYQLLDLVPEARDAAVDSMTDAMVAIDASNRVVDLNQAASELLGQSESSVVGLTLGTLMPQYRDLFLQYEDELQAHDELRLELGGQPQWYDMQLSPLYDRRHRLRGRLIVLRDISERKELQASLETQIRRVNQLLEVARATIEHPTLEATLQNTLDIAAALTHAGEGSIFLVDAQLKVTQSILTRGPMPPLMRQAILRLVLGQGLIGWVLRRGETAIVDDTESDPRWVTLPDQPYEARSALGVPIRHGDRVLGALILLHPNPNHFDQEHASTLEAAARQMALAIRNTQVYEAQRRLADQQATLYNALRALQRPMLLQEMITETVQVIASLTEWPLVALMAIDESGDLQVEATAGALTRQVSLESWLACEAVSQSLLTGQEAYIPDAQCVAEGMLEEPSSSVLIIPLKKEDEIQRVLFLAVDVPMGFDEDAQLLARSLGDVVALILRNAQLYETVSIERQRLAALVQSNRDGIILIGMDDDVLVINQPALDDLGIEGTPEDWVYRPVGDLLSDLEERAPFFAQAARAQMRRVAEGDESIGEGEHDVDGRVVHWLNLPVTEGERALGRLTILRDVTEERAISQMREDLTHTMVHDLRNPLTGIFGALQMLEEPLRETLSLDNAGMLDIAMRNTGRMLDMVNAILDISRLESGRMPLSPTIFAVGEAVGEAIDLERPLAERKNIVLVNSVAENLPPVWADQRLIGRVLQNLVGNALKFTPDGGVVRIQAQVPIDAPDKLFVSVIDTGFGVPADIRSQIFQKFVTGQQEGHGSGLGLAFCRMVLEAHEERIWVESMPGEGTSFAFSLPLAAEVMG